MNVKWTKRFLAITLGLGVGLGSAATASAQQFAHHGRQGGVIIYPQAQPACPAAPAHPGDLPPAQPGQQPAQQPEALNQAPMEGGFDSSSSGLGGEGSGGAASSVGNLGRADFNSRFNLFDNFAALPTTRVWFGFQRLNDYQTNVINQLGQPQLIGSSRNINLYRVGIEYAFDPNISVAFQTQYIATTGGTGGDSWANPQVLGKFALINEEATVITAVLGAQFRNSLTEGEIHDRSFRLYPGVLFFQGLGDNLFAQGGAQFGYNWNRSGAQTVDYALSLGYWAYRADHLDIAGRRIYDCPERRFLVGVIPMIEILAAHAIAGTQTATFIGGDPGLGQARFQGSTVQSRNVYDLTVGGRILFTDRLSMGAAYSRPLTGAYVRDDEFLMTLNFNF